MENCLPITITNVIARDIRFPTSRTLDGSDAMNLDPDYSAAYVILETDHPAGLAGHGLTFTIGRGNEVCVAAINALAPLVPGKPLWKLVADMAPAELLRCIDFRYISDAIAPGEALALLERNAPTRAERE